MKNKELFIKIILITLAVVVGGVAGGIYYYKIKKDKKQNTNITPTKDESIIIDENTKWKLYQNEKHSFEIKYPEDWTFDVDASENNFSIKEPTNTIPLALNILFTDEKFSEVVAKEQASFGEWQKNAISEPSGETNDIVFAGIPAKEFIYHSPVGFTTQRIILSRNNQTVTIDIYKGILESILATFKFIGQSVQNDTPIQNPDLNEVKQNSIRLDGWQTYNTVEHGWKTGLEVTIKYPSEWGNIYGAGGTFVNAMLADYSMRHYISEDGLCEYDGTKPDTPECANAMVFHSVIPDEYCGLSFSYNGATPEKGLGVKLENKYTDNSKKENCNAILEAMKGTLVSKITPITYYTE